MRYSKHKNDFSWILILLAFIIMASFFSGCTNVKKKKSKKIDATLNLAEAYMSQRNYTAALKELLKALDLAPDNAMVHHYLGDVYIAKKRYDLSVQHYQKAVKLKPDFIPAINSLGVAYIKMENWDLAIDVFEQISGNLLYATPHYPLGNLGWAYYNKRDYESAEYYYLMALDKSPDFIVALRGLGRTYQKMNRISEAIDVYKKAIKKDAESPILRMELGDLYLISQDYKQAVECFEKVKELATPLQKELSSEAEQKILHIKKVYY
ncbi:MAG: hypothetical protein CSA22_07325 [Deltaproteobacteria bacterium]|nr:MAG: hypothetical protein CSA22_07325 [Deltaproteobacteria bacterium]